MSKVCFASYPEVNSSALITAQTQAEVRQEISVYFLRYFEFTKDRTRTNLLHLVRRGRADICPTGKLFRDIYDAIEFKFTSRRYGAHRKGSAVRHKKGRPSQITDK